MHVYTYEWITVSMNIRAQTHTGTPRKRRLWQWGACSKMRRDRSVSSLAGMSDSSWLSQTPKTSPTRHRKKNLPCTELQMQCNFAGIFKKSSNLNFPVQKFGNTGDFRRYQQNRILNSARQFGFSYFFWRWVISTGKRYHAQSKTELSLQDPYARKQHDMSQIHAKKNS